MFTRLLSYFTTSKNVNVNEINYNDYENILEYIPNNKLKINNKKFKTNELITSVEKFINNENKKKFIVSLSGGIDSMVLISIIKYLNYDVIACHINYNNRKETKDEQKFIEDWCAYNSIKLYVKEIQDIKRENSKRSDYELVTKNIRFDFYNEIIANENTNIVLLGHHKDDIVENIFANVCRGRYILDLAVIKNKSIINNVLIARPLIDHYKSSIYNFADENQIPYFKDTTPDWSIRGKYRNQIYPLIEDAFSKNIKNNLIGLSKQSYDWNILIMKTIVNPFMQSINIENNVVNFNVKDYLDYPVCFWNLVFMKIFYKFNKNCPSRKALHSFMNSIPGIGQIPISNSCICNIKNDDVKIVFKN